MKIINKFIAKLFNLYCKKNENNIIITFKDEPIDLETSTKIIKEYEETEEINKYKNKYW